MNRKLTLAALCFIALIYVYVVNAKGSTSKDVAVERLAE